MERHGFLGPIRASQAAVVLGGVVCGLLLLGGSPSMGRAVGAIVVFAVSVALATAEFGSRTAEQWLLVAGGWAARRVLGLTAFHSRAPTSGALISPRADTMPVERDLTIPRALSGIRILELPYRGRLVGAVSDRRGRLLTAVLACRVVSFSLLDATTQERNLSHWGAVLSGCADTPVRRIQWLERTSPTEGNELARWLQAE
ncbi:MAG TPA: SCO6880 family protein, partial [Solirubrobacteraceae bacterium]